MSYATRRRAKRDQHRAAVLAQMQAPISDAVRGPDPLEHRRSAACILMARVLALTGAATLAHGLVLGPFFLVGLFSAGAEAHVAETRMTVELVEAVPIVAAATPVESRVITPPEPEPEPAPEPEAKLQPEPKPEAPPEPPKPKPQRRRARKEPPPDPMEERQETAKTPNTPKPQRRVVGLNLESTTTSGSGPAFAVGTTRMGETETTALDPRIASQRPAAREPRREAEAPASPNKVASHVPVRDERFEKPRRVGQVKPAYPELLRKQGVEADVTVRVTIDAAGHTTEVEVLGGSGYPELDEAARKATLEERFEPATRDGRPVEHSIQYTYRFRLSH